MNVVFMGTPDFALPPLRRLAGTPGHRITAVVTRPDRPRGRHHQHTFPPPVKQLAEELGLRIIQPESVNEQGTIRTLEGLAPDLIVVVAFGQKLSREFLGIPRIACINLHASLLPKYRGAAPIAQAIIDGEKVTGVTAQKVAYEIDTGDVIDKEVVEIGPDETAGELERRLAVVAGDLLIRVLDTYEDSTVSCTPQREESASYVRRVKKEDALINWNQPAENIHNFVRGMNPRPGAFAFLPGKGDRPKKRLIVLRSRVEAKNESREPGRPGTILGTSDQGIQVAAGAGSLWITRLQPEGGREMTAREYLLGHHVVDGECFVS
ncbi:MAG: methionyl-tRNA formyltransferase [Candidatus Brocadiales bacterium]|nr:methionyl-tRNA formyltransferase [Candidatus Bathyanammoxibius sp.]